MEWFGLSEKVNPTQLNRPRINGRLIVSPGKRASAKADQSYFNNFP